MPRLTCAPVLPRRRVLFLGAGAATLCGCGAQHELPAAPRAQVDEARQAIAAAGPLQRKRSATTALFVLVLMG